MMSSNGFQKKNQKRTESFIKLSKEYKIDFGFVVYKTSSVMVEFFTIPELERKLKGERIIDHNLLEKSKIYYEDFDNQVRTLVESFMEAEVILVSDHSEVKTSFEVDINYFLQNNGFQTSLPKKSFDQIVRFMKHSIKPIIPFSFRKKLRDSKIIPQASDNHIVFDPNKSIAFYVCMGDWGRGIYINDKERFNGIVSQDDIIRYSHKISTSINNDNIAKKHGITSHVKDIFDTSLSKYYPDVVLDVPDGYIVRNNAKGFVTEFESIKINSTNVDTIKTWSKVWSKGNWKSYCVRGYHPIAVSSRKWTENNCPTSSDLTLIYRHLLKQFK